MSVRYSWFIDLSKSSISLLVFFLVLSIIEIELLTSTTFYWAVYSSLQFCQLLYMSMFIIVITYLWIDHFINIWYSCLSLKFWSVKIYFLWYIRAISGLFFLTICMKCFISWMKFISFQECLKCFNNEICFIFSLLIYCVCASKGSLL